MLKYKCRMELGKKYMWKVKIKWFHILIIGEVALVMILLATCFGKDELRCVYYGDDMYETATLNPENSKIVTAGMKMSAGVYRVNVKSSMDTTELLGVTVCNNRGYTDSLLDNSIIVFGGNDDCNFDFFLTDTAYGVYLDIDYGKTDLSQIQEISIWKTRGGNRILLFITLLFFTGIDAVLYEFMYKRAYFTKRTNCYNFAGRSYFVTICSLL